MPKPLEEGTPGKPKLWAPPENLHPNVGKMAWAMYLKWWEFMLTRPSTPEAEMSAMCVSWYRSCVEVAKLLEEINRPKSNTGL